MVPLASILVSHDLSLAAAHRRRCLVWLGAFCVLTIAINRHYLLLRCHVRGYQC